jgi:hypothetical protein
MVAELAADASDDWWIIGSAAVALHGAQVPAVRDIDLLMSARDAERFLKRVGGRERAGKPSAKFRSDVFGTWVDPPLPVEVMGGFSLAIAGEWCPVLPETRERKTIGGQVLFVPSAAELKAMLLSFGRPKDIDRASLLS